MQIAIDFIFSFEFVFEIKVSHFIIIHQTYERTPLFVTHTHTHTIIAGSRIERHFSLENSLATEQTIKSIQFRRNRRQSRTSVLWHQHIAFSNERHIQNCVITLYSVNDREHSRTSTKRQMYSFGFTRQNNCTGQPLEPEQETKSIFATEIIILLSIPIVQSTRNNLSI